MKNFQQTPPFNPPQMFYTTQRRRRRWWRRGQKIRHCFCMFCVCVCVWKKLCSKNSVLSNFSLLLLLQAVPFFDVHRCYCLNREAFWIAHFLGQESTLEVFFLNYCFTISTNFEIWDEICWIFFLWVSTIEDGCDFLLRGHDPDPGWPPGLLRWRWMTFTVCVCLYKTYAYHKMVNFSFFSLINANIAA